MVEKELLKMMNEEDDKFDKKFSSISETNRDEIKGNAKIKWVENFNAEKSTANQPERYFYQLCLKQAQSDWYKATTAPQKDLEGNPTLDERGKQIREKKIPTVTIHENTDNDLDENEESNFNENIKVDSVDISKIASDDTIGIHEPNKEYTLEKHLKEKFRWYYGEVPKEIMTYYLLCDKVKTRGFYIQPLIKKEYKPTKDSIPYPLKPEFNNLSDESKEALRRLQYLKNAENRMWMEMAISKMRESKEKLEQYVSGWDEEKQNKFRKETPILSSVILNRDEKFVTTCFKGKVERKHTNKKGIIKDVTFDNHCEFSLFTDIIKEENLHLVQDGILYVTLEPCNKRGFWLDGKDEKPKIPCAVRCLETGLKKVYIGSTDDHKTVKNKGKEILESGKYTFKMKNGKLDGTDKEIKEEGLLEQYFQEKNYPSEDFDDRRVYIIGTAIEVLDFEPDLIEEVRQLNSEFLQRHSPSQFRL